MSLNKRKDNLPIADYGSVYFHVIGDQEIIQKSSSQIITGDLTKDGKPILNGPISLSMGTTDDNYNCITCGNNKKICPGHFGHVVLRYPVKNPLFRDDLLKWLKIICYNCGETVQPIPTNFDKTKIMSEMLKIVKGTEKCCNEKCQYAYMNVIRSKDNPAIFLRTSVQDKKVIIQKEYFNHEIKKTLNKISNQTCTLLGRCVDSHPNKFVLDAIAAPPNQMRPDLKKNNVRSSSSDTTYLLKVIIEQNNKIPEHIPDNPDHFIEELKNSFVNLDMHYYAMIKGGTIGELKLLTNTNKVPVSIADHIPKKSGRIRKNLMGKKCSYMIRSVIIGNAKIPIDCVGVPLRHARNLEIPEVVMESNKERMQLYYNNHTEYPGCKTIIKKNGGNYNRKMVGDKYQLEIGDTVMRDMIDGDYVNFNRQPSLIFSSIAGMKVQIVQGFALQINPAICNYFNADFDGDQMNCIVPQCVAARVECMYLSGATRWMISPQNSAPLVGAFQDALIGLSELTKNDVLFNKWHAMSLLSDVHNLAFNLTEDRVYTNRELVSKLLPQINYLKKTPLMYKKGFERLLKYDPKDIELNIVRGELISGIIDKASAGQGNPGSIFHIVANEYGNDYALQLIYNLQQVVHKFITYHGFTTGIRDVTISDETKIMIKDKLEAMILESRRVTYELNKGQLIPPLDMTLKQFNEIQQDTVLKPGDDFVEPILENVDLDSNGMIRLILTGSKGSMPNFLSMNGAIGMQNSGGKKFLEQCGYGRVLPYFPRYDPEPIANGYVPYSFIEGIKSIVFPYTCAEARSGFINNALSTSVTGYQNRISSKNLESIIVNNLRQSVKNYNIIQPLYADCGLDPAKLEKVKFPTVMIDDSSFNEYNASLLLNGPGVNIVKNDKNISLCQTEFKQLEADRNQYRQIFFNIEARNPLKTIDDTAKMPINVARIIDDTVFNYKILKNQPLDVEDALYKVEDLCLMLSFSHYSIHYQKKHDIMPEYIESSVTLLRILLRSYLCVSQLLKKNISNDMLNIIVDKCLYVFKNSLIDPGMTVGILATLCVSEPMTQYILNSKHRTGGLGGSKTDAIERIKEILSARREIKNSMMILNVKKEYQLDKVKVQEIANHIEMMYFDRFITSESISFEEFGLPVNSTFKHESSIIANIMKLNLGKNIPSDISKWCIRFTLSKEELIQRSISIETIVLSLQALHSDLYIIHTPENVKEPFIRCYLRTGKLKENNDFYRKYVLPKLTKLKNSIVRGVKDVTRTSVEEMQKSYITETGAIDKKTIYTIMTNGSNLAEIIKNPYLDNRECHTNDIMQIYDLFGVEAAKKKIDQELLGVLAGTSAIHNSIFVDEMTSIGMISSIHTSGLSKREKSNVTLRLSFQKPIQITTEAALGCITNQIFGISSSLVLGGGINIGSTYNAITIKNDEGEDVVNFDDL